MKWYKKVTLRTGLLLATMALFTGAYSVNAETKTQQYEKQYQQYIDNADKDDDPEYGTYIESLENDSTEQSQTIRKGSLAAGNYVHNSKFANNYVVIDGVDVSKYQGYIAWDDMKASGVDFAIIRVGYRGYTSGNLAEDETYKENIQRALNAGVKVGVYIFSQAITEAEAAEEANFVLNRIRSYNITLPVAIDYEYVSGTNTRGRLYNAGLSAGTATAVVNKFCQTVASAGYTPMVYANKNMLQSNLNASSITDKYDVWLANYTSQTTYGGDYTFWQYSSSGKMNGLGSDKVVDCDFWYVPKSRIDGLDKAKDGNWYYYVNGVINKNYTGLKQNDSGWWYVKNGKIDFKYTGLVKNGKGWWYVRNGAVDFNYDGLAQNDAGWWCVQGGAVRFDYTGLKYDPVVGWWYVVNGAVDFQGTGLVCDKNIGWWYVVNGAVNFGTGLVYDENVGWWYVVDGAVNFGTGLVYDENVGWWYVVNGTVAFDYTGLVNDANVGWWYVVGGAVYFQGTGLVYDEQAGWRYVVGGVVNTDYTGLVYDENVGWWYVENGKVNFNYSGLVQNDSGLWLVQNGTVNFGYTGEMTYDGIVYDVYGGSAVRR